MTQVKKSLISILMVVIVIASFLIGGTIFKSIEQKRNVDLFINHFQAEMNNCDKLLAMANEWNSNLNNQNFDKNLYLKFVSKIIQLQQKCDNYYSVTKETEIRKLKNSFDVIYWLVATGYSYNSKVISDGLLKDEKISDNEIAFLNELKADFQKLMVKSSKNEFLANCKKFNDKYNQLQEMNYIN